MSTNNSAGRPAKASRPLSRDPSTRTIDSEDSGPGRAPQFPLVIAQCQRSADEVVRVAIDDERGNAVVDIRIFATFTMARALTPTKRGLTVPPEMLPDLIDTLQDAATRARRLGLLSDRG